MNKKIKGSLLLELAIYVGATSCLLLIVNHYKNPIFCGILELEVRVVENYKTDEVYNVKIFPHLTIKKNGNNLVISGFKNADERKKIITHLKSFEENGDNLVSIN